MFFALGVVAVMVPLLILFSMIGGSQAKQAVHFHERITTEAISWSALEAGIAKLQASGGADLFTGTISDGDYQVSLNPTGIGMASQTIFNVYAKGWKGNNQNIFMTCFEQFPRSVSAPSEPNLVITHDFWGTVQPYDITQAFDCVAIQNARGADYLAWEQAIAFELSKSGSEYRTLMQGKGAGLPPALPAEIVARWPAIVEVLVAQKTILPP